VKAFKIQMDKIITQKFVLEQSGILHNGSDDSLIQPSQVHVDTFEDQKPIETQTIEETEEETFPTIETRQIE